MVEHFRTLSDLNELICANLSKLPRDLDLVVVIPRSGLLPGSLISLYLNLPLTDIEGLFERRLIKAGYRLVAGIDETIFERPLRVLVVDDSVYAGTQMRAVRRRIEEANLGHRVYYLAPYATPESVDVVDFALELLPTNRVFAWNVMHHSMLNRACVDIDGVLCVDPTSEQNDDGERYREFIQSARPLFTPTVEVGWLVTCRLEKYRELTEQWLARHNIQYRELIMMDLPDKETRVRLGGHARFKADAYRATEAHMFIESDPQQAQEIARLSGEPVLCMGNQTLVHPSIVARTPTSFRKSIRRVKRRLTRLFSTFDALVL